MRNSEISEKISTITSKTVTMVKHPPMTVVGWGVRCERGDDDEVEEAEEAAAKTLAHSLVCWFTPSTALRCESSREKYLLICATSTCYSVVIFL